MKNYTLFIIGTVLTIQTHAQITLTSATSVPNIGDSYAFVVGNSTLNFDQNGANQTWDFSSLTGTAATYNYINLSNSLEPATYPSANVVENASGSEGYLTNTSTEYSYIGQYIPGSGRIIYTDPRKYLIFPMNYNDVFNDTWSGTVENIQSAQTFDRAGSTEITVDGYGTLILPTGTVTNVLRVRAVANYEDEYQGFPIGTYTDTIYTWYEAATNNFIASHSISWANFSLVLKFSSYMDNSLVGIDDPTSTVSDFTLFPNPATDFVQMKSSSKVLSLQITDMTGKIFRTIDFSKQQEGGFNVSDLPKGIYIVTCTSSTGQHSKRIMVE